MRFVVIMQNAKVKQINIRLPVDAAKRLKMLAVEQNTSVQKLVCDAIKNYKLTKHIFG